MESPTSSWLPAARAGPVYTVWACRRRPEIVGLWDTPWHVQEARLPGQALAGSPSPCTGREEDQRALSSGTPSVPLPLRLRYVGRPASPVHRMPQVGGLRVLHERALPAAVSPMHGGRSEGS